MMIATAPWHELATWIDTTPPSAVAVGLLRPAVLLLAAYLLLTTLLYVAARAARLPALVRALGVLTLPVIRRTVDRVVAVGLVTATTSGLAAPAAAYAAPRPVVTVAADGTLLPPGLRVPSAVAPDPVPARPPVPVPSPPSPPVGPTPPAEVEAHGPPTPASAPTPALTPTAPPAPSGARVHVVAPGEHLWAIAARQVAAARGVDASELTAADVAPQWRRIVAVNAPRLRSGDPDLVHPGESVVLPDLD